MTSLIDGLLSSLWRATWQGALALLFVWILSRVLARRLTADTHCWLWRLSYVKLLVGLIWSGAIIVPLLSPAPLPLPMSQPQATFTPNHVETAEKVAVSTSTSPSFPAVAQAEPWLTWQTGVAAAYLLGVAVCLGRLLLAARRTRHALRSAVPNAAGPETACAMSLAHTMRLRRVPSLARSTAVDGPVFMAGRVLLPAEAHYSEADLRLILAHELAHARRHDLSWEWLGTLVQVMFFFHPLVVLARREERLTREAAADSLALEATGAIAADYGRMLLSLALEQNQQRPVLLGAVGVIEGGTLLRRRLLALRDAASRTGTCRNRWRIVVALVPLTALVLVPWQLSRGHAQTAASIPVPVTPLYPTMPVGNKRITGVILNERKEPVTGLGVSLVWKWSQKSRIGGTMTGSRGVDHVLTDAQGRFGFSRLPVGEFVYEVYSPTNQYVPIQAPLRLGKAETQKVLRVVVSSGSLVTGRVVDGQTGKPMAGVFVGAGSVPPGGDLSKWDYWAMPSMGVTDAQGRYQVRVTPGDVFIGVGRVDDGTVPTRRIREAVRRVSVRAGQTASAPDIPVLLRPAIVFVGPDGQPVANTTVRITAVDMTRGPNILEDRTDRTGTLVLGRGGSGADSKSGTFSVAQAGMTAHGRFHSSPDGPLVMNVDGQTFTYPSGVGTVRLTEGSASVVTGTVISEGGNPIPNAVIRITETDPKSHYGLGDQVFRTNTAGVFRAPLDPNGQYHAYVRADGFNQVSVSDAPLAVVKGRTTDLGLIHLVRADGFVSGRVVDRLGKPMAGVLASVNGEKTLVSAAMTDSQGYFRIPNVVSGETLRLNLCLKGEVSDSGTAMLQSNEMMDIRGVKASPVVRQIVWHPHL